MPILLEHTELDLAIVIAAAVTSWDVHGARGDAKKGK